ncbi:DUF3857 domain-containing protein [Christiangramia aquimixticola]|uniref:DUF3857 domain-containing protein n=1 Tax=Christiangramia aquimixticola TaxID=1697558 RepID=UPI003AA80B96
MLKTTTCLIFLFMGASLFSQNFKYGKVSKEEVKEKQHPLEENAGAAILYSYQRTFFEYNQSTGFNLVSEYHQRIKIYTKEGFDWATKEISSRQGNLEENVSSIKGVTYNLENGKLVETKLDRDNIYKEDASRYRKITKFTMPAVKEGSVIEFEYRKSSDKITTSLDRVTLQHTIPINKLDISVTIPEYFNFGVYNNPKAAIYVKVDMENKPFVKSFTNTYRDDSDSRLTRTGTRNTRVEFMQTSYVVEQENIPSLQEENHVDHLENYAAFLDWELKFVNFPNSPMENYSQTWEGVSKSLYQDNGFERHLRSTGFFEDDLKQLLGTTGDPMEKLSRIFEFVKRKVKWNDYIGFIPENGLKAAYKEGSGNTADINLLLVSMLKYAGLDADPVLVSTARNGIPLYPTKSGFNYLVAAVKFNGNTLLMDATDAAAGPGELPKIARNWQGRLVREDGTSEWVSLQPEYFSIDRTRLNVQMTGTAIKGKYINTKDGLYAKNYRTAHGTAESATEALSKGSTGYNTSGVELKNFEKIGKDITGSYTFETANGQDMIGDKIYFKPLFFQTTTVNPFKAEKRIYPVYFDFPSQKHNLVNIMIPDGYEISSLPESIILKLKENSGEFRFLVTSNKNFIRIDSQLNISQIIYPSTDYEIIQKFFNNIIEKQNESIVLSKISTDGLEERAESGR